MKMEHTNPWHTRVSNSKVYSNAKVPTRAAQWRGTGAPDACDALRRNHHWRLGKRARRSIQGQSYSVRDGHKAKVARTQGAG